MPMIVQAGQTVTIECDASGQEPIEVQWHGDNNEPLPHRVQTRGRSLYFNYITQADEGKYSCTARNDHGEITRVAQVIVNSKFHILWWIYL